jgi:hypothetical protein
MITVMHSQIPTVFRRSCSSKNESQDYFKTLYHMLPYNSIRYDEFFAAKAVLSSTADNYTHILSVVFTLSGFGDTQTSLGGKNTAAYFNCFCQSFSRKNNQNIQSIDRISDFFPSIKTTLVIIFAVTIAISCTSVNFNANIICCSYTHNNIVLHCKQRIFSVRKDRY